MKKINKNMKTLLMHIKIGDNGHIIKPNQEKIEHRKFSKDEIIEEILSILPNIRTTEKLPTFNDRFNTEHITHIFEVYKLNEREV